MRKAAGSRDAEVSRRYHRHTRRDVRVRARRNGRFKLQIPSSPPPVPPIRSVLSVLPPSARDTMIAPATATGAGRTSAAGAVALTANPGLPDIRNDRRLWSRSAPRRAALFSAKHRHVVTCVPERRTGPQDETAHALWRVDSIVGRRCSMSTSVQEKISSERKLAQSMCLAEGKIKYFFVSDTIF